MSQLYKGFIDRVTYHNPDSGYTIARLAVEGERERLTIVGALASVQEGENVEVEGLWENHPKYGKQLKIENYKSVYPSTLEGIQKYLGSGLIKGIGPVSAKRIVAHFGAETLDIIDADPQRLGEVPKLGQKRVDLIAAAWGEQRQIKDVMVFLQSHGITTGYAVKIFKEYGQEAIHKVRSNPYRLERDVAGIGFRIADRIAQNLGLGREAPARVQAGIRYLLTQAADDGHVFLPAVELMERAREILEINAELLPPALEDLRADDGVVTEGTHYYLPPLHRAEVGAASSLQRLLREPAEPLQIVLETDEDGLELALAQKQAVELVAVSKVMVLTGGPGTGKTTVTRRILRLLEEDELKVALCSPTGRAAKRLSEACGREARTIHRLLEFQPAERRFKKGYDDRLDIDALIVDEASMIDVVLMNALLRALPDAARLVLVGDVDQLPSVGPGNVLSDIIDSGEIPVVRLTQIFRQDEASHIVRNAHLINDGAMPVIDNSVSADFYFARESDPAKVVALVEELCAARLPGHGGWDPLRDIQVLSPMYRGETGALNLNQRLQQRLNAGGRPYHHRGNELRVGDKVMQVRNNYDKGVFNGDMGIVERLDADKQILWVRFDYSVEYDQADLDELTLAYAISTHRSQGSEFPVVVLPLTTQHYVMLQRNLLYTAITRAKKMVVIVGTDKALKLAIENDEVARRFTTLKQRLRGEVGPLLEAGAGERLGDDGVFSD
ncbi:MAG: ATP-dependent RecD-like DNA helicase [Candidatus Latescibacteria bacterium]|nr:ATP-dependent RecD-like DNA helicase [Candidatus Latescibacterota bacterium]